MSSALAMLPWSTAAPPQQPHVLLWSMPHSVMPCVPSQSTYVLGFTSSGFFRKFVASSRGSWLSRWGPTRPGVRGSSMLTHPPRRSGRLLGRLLLMMLLNGRHHRVAGGADEFRPVLGGPVPAGRQRLGRALEARRHVAGDQLVGVAGGGGVGPLVAHEQEGAEATRLLRQSLHLRDGIVDRADDGEARCVERVDQR